MNRNLIPAIICFIIGMVCLLWLYAANAQAGTTMGRKSIRAHNGQIVRVGDSYQTMIAVLGEPDRVRRFSGDDILVEWVSYNNLQYGLIFTLTIQNNKVTTIIAERK